LYPQRTQQTNETTQRRWLKTSVDETKNYSAELTHLRRKQTTKTYAEETKQEQNSAVWNETFAEETNKNKTQRCGHMVNERLYNSTLMNFNFLKI